MTKTKLLVEGWRGISHSYAMVNQYQLLELRQRPQIALFHLDVPFFHAEWNTPANASGFDAANREALLAIPPLQGAPDIVYRIAYPYRAYKNVEARIFCQATCEYRHIVEAWPFAPPGEGAVIDPQTHFITPSHWSKQGLINSGLTAENIHVVPHGVNSAVFHPLSPGLRAEARQRLGMSDHFVFLNIGAGTTNKGVDILLRAFAIVWRRHSNARLLLKDQRGLYGTDAGSLIDKTRRDWPGALDDITPDCVRVVGDNLDLAKLRLLYGACDAYVSPYRAEAFNLPPLEAAACGRPIIVTAGGATDDYAHDSFALKVVSREASGNGMDYLEPDLDALIEAMLQLIEGRARGLDSEAGVRRIAEEFSWGRAVDKLLAAFGT